MAPWWNERENLSTKDRRRRRSIALRVALFMVGELALIALICYALARGAWLAN